jgi:hypothetical protein
MLATSLGGLADNFEITDHGILNKRARHEGFLPFAGVVLYAPYCARMWLR